MPGDFIAKATTTKRKWLVRRSDVIADFIETLEQGGDNRDDLLKQAYENPQIIDQWFKEQWYDFAQIEKCGVLIEDAGAETIAGLLLWADGESGWPELICVSDVTDFELPSAVKLKPEPVLDKPASVGGLRFHAGLPVRYVIEAAQRRYDQEESPEGKAERKTNADRIIDSVRPLEPVNQRMLVALKEIARITGDAGFNVGGPLQNATGNESAATAMEFLRLAANYLEEISKVSAAAIAAAESAQAQQPADGVVLDALTIKLRLVEDELPVLEKFGSSYGGEWSSGWVVLFSPDGSCDVHRLTVSGEKDKKEEAEARKRSSGKWLTGFIWQYDYTAWCYLDEVTSALAAHKAQEGGK